MDPAEAPDWTERTRRTGSIGGFFFFFFFEVAGRPAFFYIYIYIYILSPLNVL